MLNIIVERLMKLFSIKSLVTLALTATLVALMFSDKEPNKELLTLFCTSYGAIMAYFFTKKEN